MAEAGEATIESVLHCQWGFHRRRRRHRRIEPTTIASHRFTDVPEQIDRLILIGLCFDNPPWNFSYLSGFVFSAWVPQAVADGIMKHPAGDGRTRSMNLSNHNEKAFWCSSSVKSLVGKCFWPTAKLCSKHQLDEGNRNVGIPILQLVVKVGKKYTIYILSRNRAWVHSSSTGEKSNWTELKICI